MCPAIPRHKLFYFQIFCLFFTTMLYKLLKREDQGLSPRKCFINILNFFYTALQNCVLAYASTLALYVLSDFGNVKTRISLFLLVGAFCLLSRLSRAKYSSPISATSLSESNIYTPSVFCYDEHKKNFDIHFSMKKHTWRMSRLLRRLFWIPPCCVFKNGYFIAKMGNFDKV